MLDLGNGRQLYHKSIIIYTQDSFFFRIRVCRSYWRICVVKTKRPNQHPKTRPIALVRGSNIQKNDPSSAGRFIRVGHNPIQRYSGHPLLRPLHIATGHPPGQFSLKTPHPMPNCEISYGCSFPPSSYVATPVLFVTLKSHHRGKLSRSAQCAVIPLITNVDGNLLLVSINNRKRLKKPPSHSQ